VDDGGRVIALSDKGESFATFNQLKKRIVVYRFKEGPHEMDTEQVQSIELPDEAGSQSGLQRMLRKRVLSTSTIDQQSHQQFLINEKGDVLIVT